MGTCFASVCSGMWCIGEVHRCTFCYFRTAQTSLIINSNSGQERLWCFCSVAASTSAICWLPIWSTSLNCHWCCSRHFCKLWQCSSDRPKCCSKNDWNVIHRNNFASQWQSNKLAIRIVSAFAGKTLLWTQPFFSTESLVSWSQVLTWNNS